MKRERESAYSLPTDVTTHCSQTSPLNSCQQVNSSMDSIATLPVTMYFHTFTSMVLSHSNFECKPWALPVASNLKFDFEIQRHYKQSQY